MRYEVKIENAYAAGDPEEAATLFLRSLRDKESSWAVCVTDEDGRECYVIPAARIVCANGDHL